jgi:hypothetical protein
MDSIEALDNMITLPGRVISQRNRGNKTTVPITMERIKVLYIGNCLVYRTIIEYNPQEITAKITMISPRLKDRAANAVNDPLDIIYITPTRVHNTPITWFLFNLSFKIKKDKIPIITGEVVKIREALIEVV